MAVIFGTRGPTLRGIAVLLVVVFFVASSANPRGCDPAKLRFRSTPFAGNENILSIPANGEICGSDSCCGPKFEDQLMIHSRNHLDKFMKESIHRLSSILDTRAKRFDEFFRNMLFNSKKEFHEMFKRTYGAIYLQHSFVFTDFFEELEQYYSSGRVRLAEAMDTFFGILYQRMFTVINGQYQFDERYLECVADHMSDLKPFGDVPHKLGVQLRRSFVATRAYYKSLVKSAEVVKNMGSLPLSQQCGKYLARMQYCDKCKGMESTGACSPYCVSVLKDCLQSYTALDNHWNSFVDALDKVADRLLGPFNIEMVVEPINIKISEAVMIFQESGAEVSQRIFAGCGQPSMGRRKRSALNVTITETTTSQSVEEPRTAARKSEITAEPAGFGQKKKKKKVEAVVPSMEKLIKDIKQKVKESRQFWSHLPYQYCNNEQITAAPSAGTCWNGTDLGKFEPQDLSQPTEPPKSPILNTQTYTLQELITKLQSAHQGQDVELIDDSEDSNLSGSGSGDDESSGDGSTIEVTVAQTSSVETQAPPTAAPPALSTTRPPEVVKKSSNAPPLTRALAYYVMPIVLVWFGGAFLDLLL